VLARIPFDRLQQPDPTTFRASLQQRKRDPRIEMRPTVDRVHFHLYTFPPHLLDQLLLVRCYQLGRPVLDEDPESRGVLGVHEGLEGAGDGRAEVRVRQQRVGRVMSGHGGVDTSVQMWGKNVGRYRFVRRM
jgi:hypothetical protein